MLFEGCPLISAPNCLAEGLGFVTDLEITRNAKTCETGQLGAEERECRLRLFCFSEYDELVQKRSGSVVCLNERAQGHEAVCARLPTVYIQSSTRKRRSAS